jgi:ubiquinone/menaquinone biosynthesis C-methylase UbiE
MTAHTRTGAATAVTLPDPALTRPLTSTPASQETAMTSATYRHYSGTAAELYQSFFVPSIATPVSGELLRTAALQPGTQVLDVACGTGVVTRAAAEQVGPTGSVTGIDVAPDMIAVAKTIPAGGAPIIWHEADAASLPLPDEFYDVGLCQMGLMFMEDRAGALGELHRVVALGGRVVINTPGRIQPLFEVMEQAIADNLDPGLSTFVSAVFSMHDPSVLADLLQEAGFGDVTSKEYTATFDLPGPAEFLWNYINLTPMGPLVADASEEAKAAMERQVVEAWTPSVVNGRIPVEQPMALAWGVRS